MNILLRPDGFNPKTEGATEDEPEQEALFYIEGPDERGCVWMHGTSSRGDRSRGAGTLLIAGTVERAFQLAPECETLDQLRGKLIGHLGVDAHLLSGSLGKQLKKLLRSRPA